MEAERRRLQRQRQGVDEAAEPELNVSGLETALTLLCNTDHEPAEIVLDSLLTLYT